MTICLWKRDIMDVAAMKKRIREKWESRVALLRRSFDCRRSINRPLTS